jgi:Tfp pilus assembly protein PilF
MHIMRFLARRAALSISVALTACAAANPGAASDPAAGDAYGSFLAARYADAQQDSAAASHYYGMALAADPGNQSLIDEGFIAAVLSGSPQAQTLAPQVTGNALAIMLLGNQAAGIGDFAGAQAQYELLPHDSLSSLLEPLLIAWAKAGAGDPSDALAELEPLAGGSPFGAVYILNAALIADQADDMKDAVQLYGDADAGDQSPNLRIAQIMASWKARQGDITSARTILEEMAATHPALASALPTLEAKIAAPVVSSATDGLAEAYLSIAGALNQPSQTLLQVTFLRFALSLRPDLAAARLLLANVQSGAENTDPDRQPARPGTGHAAADPGYRPALRPRRDAGGESARRAQPAGPGRGAAQPPPRAAAQQYRRDGKRRRHPAGQQPVHRRDPILRQGAGRPAQTAATGRVVLVLRPRHLQRPERRLDRGRTGFADRAQPVAESTLCVKLFGLHLGAERRESRQGAGDVATGCGFGPE